MKIFYRALLIFFGLLLVTALIGRFYIAYHSKELFQKIVSRVTHDAYRLEAKSVDFYFWNPGISGEKIKLIPNTHQQKQATLSLERAEFRLNSLWRLIGNRSLEVKTIKIIKPELTAWAKKSSGSDKKGISETFYAIQLKLFELIDVLKVEEVLMEDASLKIFTAGAADGSFLGINHLTLKLDDIEVLPSINAGTPNIKLDGSLTLLKPDIHLPDSNIAASLGKLQATISSRSLIIDELDFSIANADNQKQKLTLSSIRVNQLNWERYLKEGVIEVDTIYANKGFANIHLLPKVDKPSKEPLAKKTGYKGASVIIHHTVISDVAYNLNREKSKNGREKQVNMSLKGDSLYFEDFSLINGRQPAVQVKKLAIALREVKEGDNKGDMRFSLGALNLDSNSLVLKNYLLETNADNKNKNYLRVAVPGFRLENYSLEEIFQKRIAATSIHLVNPDITFDIRQEKKKDKGSKKKLDAVFADLMQSVSSKVALDEIAIENGNFTLLPTLSPDDRITITGLSVIFDAGKFPQINDFHDFINAIRRLDSKGFVVKGKNMELAINDMKLLKIPRGLYFGSVKGNFGQGKNIDLKGLTVLINDSISNYRRTSDFHASALMVESGTVSLDLIKKDRSKKPDGNAPSLLIDTLDLNNMVFTMRQGQKTGISAALHIAAGNLIFREKQFYWTKLDVQANKPDAVFGKTVFRAGNMDIIQPGIIQIRNAAGHTSGPKSDIDFKSEALNIKLGLNSTDLPALKVEDIEMKRPELNVSVRKLPKKVESTHKSGKAIGNDISLKRLLMTEPSVNLTITDTAGQQTSWHKVYTGTFILEDIHTLTEPEINVGNIAYKTTDPKSEINGIKIQPSALQLNLSRVKYNTISNFYSLRVDTLQVQNIAHTIIGKKQDTLQLDAGTIGMGGFDFAKGDSISVDKLMYGTKWWLNKANILYRTPQKNIQAWKISASGTNSVSIGLDSFAILNRQSKEEVWQSAPYEKG